MPRPLTARRQHWPAGALALAAGLVAVWARHRIFPALSWNRDEPVYLWHMELLRSGQLTAGDGGHPGLFLPWLSGHGDGVMFTQYTLGWPLVLLASRVATGSTTAALGFGAALAVVGTYAFAWELTRRRAVAVGAALVMVGSPILPIQGGVHLSYLFTLGLGLLSGTGLLAGLRTGRRLPIVASGVLLGAVFLTRPYDAVLWALAFGAYALITHRHQLRPLVGGFATCALAAVPLVAVTLAYNRHITGSLLEFPIVAVDPLDGFGFGERRLMPGYAIRDYSPGDALYSSAKHAFFLPWFLAGSYLGVVLSIAGLWLGRREGATLAVVLVGAAFPLGYLPFWGTELSSEFTRLSGPLYYLPLYACLAILIASAVTHLRPRVAMAVVAAVVLATAPVAHSRLTLNQELSEAQEPWRTSVADIEGRALVFVGDAGGYLLFGNPFSANGPGLDDRILFATDDGPEMLDLLAEQRDRTPYLQVATIGVEDRGPKEDPVAYDVSLIPVEVATGPAYRIDVTAEDPGDAAVIAVEIRVGDLVRRFSVAAGSKLPALQVGPDGTGPHDLDLPPRGTLSIRVGYGATEAEALRRPASRDDLHFRVVRDTTEVLLPAARLALVEVGDEWQWRSQAGASGVEVAVTPVPVAR